MVGMGGYQFIRVKYAPEDRNATYSVSRKKKKPKLFCSSLVLSYTVSL